MSENLFQVICWRLHCVQVKATLAPPSTPHQWWHARLPLVVGCKIGKSSPCDIKSDKTWSQRWFLSSRGCLFKCYFWFYYFMTESCVLFMIGWSGACVETLHHAASSVTFWLLYSVRKRRRSVHLCFLSQRSEEDQFYPENTGGKVPAVSENLTNEQCLCRTCSRVALTSQKTTQPHSVLWASRWLVL